MPKLYLGASNKKKKSKLKKHYEFPPTEFEPFEHQKELYNAVLNINEDGALVLDKNGFPLKPEAFNLLSCWHRRAGKDYTYFMLLFFIAIINPGSYFYFLPSREQVRKVFEFSRDKNGKNFIDLVTQYEFVKYNKVHSLITIDLPDRPKSTIMLAGANNYDGQMGTNANGMIFSEASLINEKAISYFTPVLAQSKGFKWFNGTPRGKNHFYKRLKSYQNNKDAICIIKTIEDTGIVTEEEVSKQIRLGDISYEKARQEYYCDFESSSETSTFGWYITELLKDEQRYREIKHNPAYPVYASFDLGYNDSTCCVVFQVTRHGIEVLHFFEDKQKHILHYIKELFIYCSENKIKLKGIILPHDGKHQSAKSKSYEDIILDELFENNITHIEVHTLPRALTKQIQIENTRRFFQNVSINKNNSTENLIEYLKNWVVPDDYAEIDNKKLNKHYSNGVESFMYAIDAFYEQVYSIDKLSRMIKKFLEELDYNDLDDFSLNNDFSHLN